jgi:hypothetical protein
MTPDVDRALGRELAGGRRVIDVHRARTPIGNVDAAVGSRNHGVGIGAGAYALDNAARCDIDDHERVREILGDVERAAVAGER